MDLTLKALERAADLVYREMVPTPQIAWPLLADRTGCQVWVKHENHTPIGAFKARGAITFIDWLRRSHPQVKGIVTATRGNHGQAQSRAAVAAGLQITVVVPHGNGREKNASMRALGARLIEHGSNFDEAKAHAKMLSESEQLFMVPPFHEQIVSGVATYGLELLRAVPDLDTIYVPWGCGSGTCGTIAARDALGLSTKVVGVISEHADAAGRSFETGEMVETATAHTFADGVAVCAMIPEAFHYAQGKVDRFVRVCDDEVAEAIRILWQDTHNLAEGAGAVAMAALVRENEAMRGRKVGVILSGGNLDMDMAMTALSGSTPIPA